MFVIEEYSTYPASSLQNAQKNNFRLPAGSLGPGPMGPVTMLKGASACVRLLLIAFACVDLLLLAFACFCLRLLDFACCCLRWLINIYIYIYTNPLRALRLQTVLSQLPLRIYKLPSKNRVVSTLIKTKPVFLSKLVASAPTKNKSIATLKPDPRNSPQNKEGRRQRRSLQI